MAPKKKGKKKEKKKKKKEEKPPKITKTQYLAKIAESNAVLAKARSKIRGIEDTYFKTEKRFEQIKEDTADILKYLEHEIQENEEEIADFDQKIAALKAEIIKIDQYYESIFTKMENEYEEKSTALQNQIQVIEAKLLASEDVRKQKEEYLKRKEELRKKLEEMEARHALEMYEAEKQVIIKQDTMQKEMEKQVTTLATDFKQASAIAIGETTNKLIKDNIALSNMLTCMQEVIEKARDSYQKAHAVENEYRYNAELLDEENYMVLVKHTKRVDSIENLLKSHEELNDRIVACQRLTRENRRLKRQIAEKECILKGKTDEFNDLLKVQEENEDAATAVTNIYQSLKKDFVRLEFILYETAKKAKEGTDIEHVILLGEKDEKAQTGTDEEEEEENLKEFKYKTREAIIGEVLEKLSNSLQSDGGTQVKIPLSDSCSPSFEDTLSSDYGLVR